MAKSKKAKSIKGTRTEKNLVLAYVAESTAYTRYIYYAKQAMKEEYFPVQMVFEDTAANEMKHSKVFFKFLEGGSVEVPMAVDAGVIGTTSENLAIAAAEEETEGVEFYTEAAKIAQEEGFDEIALRFRSIASVENMHRKRFLKFKKMVDNGTLWKREKPVTWRCLVCGFEFKGTEPPQTCPGCDHPYQHYVAIGDADYAHEAV